MALNLPEHGRSERFITLLTTLLRRYLERQYAIPARRRTTPEFVQLLADFGTLSADDKQFLVRFLERCEAIKFADVPMPPAECSEWAQAIRQFIQRRQSSVTGQASQYFPVEKSAQSGEVIRLGWPK